MISNYLKALIDSNNRIIIPDFGAFMIQDSPEGKQISFNDFLKFNDGLLVNQIIKTDKISKNQATDLIKEFIAAVDKSFSQNKAHKVEGLGFLSKDSHGNIKFEANIETASEPKTAATDVKPTIVLDEAPVKPLATKDADKTEAKKTETTDKKQTEPAKEVKKVETPTPALSVPKIEEVKTEPIIKSAPEIKVEPKTTAPKVSDKKPVSKTMKNENNNSRTIIIIVAALVIVSIGVFGYLKFGPKKAEAPVAEVIAVPEPVIDTVAVDTLPEPVVVEEEPIDENVKKFYLIAGSFKVPSNADRFNKKLIAEGFESDVIVRKNGFHCVSYKTFYTWNEVVAEWRQMKDEKPGIWILIR